MSELDADPSLLEEYNVVERKFRNLAQDIHLPQLDVQVYTKYFINKKTEQRLEHLKIVLDALDSHRSATLRILKLVHEREQIVADILTKANEFAQKKITTLEAQTSVLQLLYKHQQISLRVVEGIFTWREALARPYPFQVRGQNYLRKILADCTFIDQCHLRTVLPLRVAQFPLCSNISALKMFGDKKIGSAPTTGASTPTKAARNPRGVLAQPPPPADPKADAELSARLRAAESILFAEQKLQTRVMRELVGLANHKQFVMLLSLPSIVPNCSTGILITDPDLEAQLREWMAAALAKAEQDVATERQAVEQNEIPQQKAIDSDDDEDSMTPRDKKVAANHETKDSGDFTPQHPPAAHGGNESTLSSATASTTFSPNSTLASKNPHNDSYRSEPESPEKKVKAASAGKNLKSPDKEYDDEFDDADD